MDKMTLATRNLVKDTRGANLVEYIMLVGLVALICIVAFKNLGGKIQSKVTDQTSTIDKDVNTGNGN